jgi:PAS domain S-box-containing protein
MAWEVRLCELELRLTQLAAENAGLRAACKQLELADAVHARLRDLAPVGLVRLDRNGVILDINRSGAALTGRERQSLARRNFTSLVAAGDIPKFTEHLRRGQRLRKTVTAELNLRGASGETIVVQMISVPVLDARSRVTQFKSTLLDITRQKRAEEALLASEKNLQAIIDASPHPIQMKDAAGHWLLANAAALELFDLNGIDYRNKNNAELGAQSPFYRQTLEARDRRDRAVIESGRPARGDESIPGPDGSTRVLDVIRSPLRHPDGRPRALVVLGYDITERVRTEGVIRAHELQLFQITNTTPVMLTRCSRDLHYRFVNRAYAEMLGLEPEAIVGKPIVEIMGAEGFKAIRPHVKRVLKGHHVEYESVVPFAGAGPRFLRAAYTPDRDARGEVLGWVASISDITEQKRAEEALRESEDRFGKMADAAPVLIWLAGPDKQCNWFNERWLEFTGRTLEQERGDGWTDGVHPDDLPRCREIYSKSFDARQEFRMEYRLKHRDGEYRWILDYGVPRITLGQEFLGYIGSCVDITEQKRMAEALWELAQFPAQNPSPVLRVHRDGTLLHANPAANALAGEWKLTVGETAPMPLCEFAVAAFLAGKNEERELAVGGRDYLVNVAPILGKDYANLYWRDITTRKQAETALRQARNELEDRVRERTAELTQSYADLQASEVKFRGFVELAPDAVLVVDERGTIVLLNARSEQMFGWSREELLGQSMERLLPERFRRSHQVHQEGFFGNPTMRQMGGGMELFGLRRNGAEFPVEISIGPLAMAGRLACSIIRDITDRKQAEKALRENEERLRLITENIEEVFWMIKADLTETYYVSPAYERIWGRTLESLRQNPRDFLDAIHPDDQTRMKALFAQLDGRTFDQEYRIIQPGGAVRWIRDRGFPVYRPGQPVPAYVGVALDITERVELEQEILRAGELERHGFARELHNGLAQQLTGISYLAGVLRQKLAEKSLPAAADAGRISDLIGDAIAQTRSLARGLHPVAEEPTGLMMALDHLAARTSALFKVDCQFRCERLVTVQDPETANHLYWIAQGAVTNAIRHGRATRIEIVLGATPAEITLTVASDGTANDSGSRYETWLRLRIMHYRANFLGGAITTRARPGEQTELICTCPAAARAVPLEKPTLKS